MGALPNPDHERFCQEVHRRVLNREKVGDARTAAYREHIYEGDGTDAAIAPNARRLAQQKHIKGRIAELGDFAAKLAGIDRDWAMVELKRDIEALKAFNLDDFLTPADDHGNRYYNFKNVTREQMEALSEYAIESEVVDVEGEVGAADQPANIQKRTVHKIRLKGPNKFAERRGILQLMADIGGWKAPIKADVTHSTLEELIRQSYKADDAKTDPADAP